MIYVQNLHTFLQGNMWSIEQSSQIFYYYIKPIDCEIFWSRKYKIINLYCDGQLETVEMETGNGKWKQSKLDANVC